MGKVPEYTKRAQAKYKQKAPTKGISIEMANLLDQHTDHGHPSIVSFSKRIAEDWLKNNSVFDETPISEISLQCEKCGNVKLAVFRGEFKIGEDKL
jgi:hypothetical protein